MPVDQGFYIFESYDYGTTWDTANLHGDGPNDYIYCVANIPQFTDASGNVIDTLTETPTDGMIQLSLMQMELHIFAIFRNTDILMMPDQAFISIISSPKQKQYGMV